MEEYELAGIETIARGVCVRDGKILLCRAKGGASTYLPGGHIEFGETGREALVREMREETGLESSTGRFLGVVENSFLQHGKPHAEINLVYELELTGGGAEVRA
ncbi:MAG: NUDIX domain-containing protein, partial [Kiritimatiellae bacterium]|nr:NUDIX domain-containing protein [Kiritimatiellia bacterium]